MDSGGQSVFQGGGELGQLMRDHDWRSTPLGDPVAWPRSLQSILRMMLTSRYQMWMAWGKALTFFCNDAYRPTLGVKFPWAIGQPAPVVWAEIWPDIGPLIDHVLATGEATYSEGMLLLLERSGYTEETYHTFSYSPLFDDAGDIAGLFCVVVEETERVITERRLGVLRQLASSTAAVNTEEALLQAVQATLSQTLADLPFTLIYLFEPDGRTARLAAQAGIEAGGPASPITLEADSAVWPVGRLIEQGGPVQVDRLSSRFQGLPTGAWDRPPHAALMAPIGQGAETMAGFVIVGLNPLRPEEKGYLDFLNLLAGQLGSALSRVRAFEAERKRAEALAEIDRAKTAFFSNVSHEFRTPLTLMLGPLEEVLADEQFKDDAARAQVDLAHRNGVRLLRLVNSLLDFSRIEAGRVEAAFAPTDLGAFSAEIASSFRSAMEKAGLNLEVKLEPLPQPVHLDREMWEKVLLNLLSNAFKFTFEGGVTIEVKPSADEGQALVVVSDTGIGVPDDEMTRLFERFHRVEGARGRTFEGSGIGLALVQELVRLHGGSISAESELGEGTRFTIALPLGTGHLPEDRLRRSSAAGGSSAHAFVEEALRWLPQPDEIIAESGVSSLVGGAGEAAAPSAGKRVLLADDNVDMRDYVRRLLMTQGYEVEAVADGEAALAALKRRRPHLLLSDVMMPGLDGFELLTAIRQDPDLAETPVILLSARAGEEAKVEGLQAGADDYLIKPFAARELLARVAANIQMADMRREAARRVLRSEQRVRMTEDRLDLALSTGRIAVFELDVAADRATLLGPLAQFFGVSQADAASGVPLQTFIDGVDPADRERVGGLIRSAIANNAPYEAEYGLVGGDKPRQVVARGGLQTGADGALRLVGAVIDISAEAQELEQRRAAERELSALNAGLEERVAIELAERLKVEEALRQAQKMEAVGQLTGGVAHDFNNLLTVILGGLDTMRRGGVGENARFGRALDMASQGALRAATLTARLLAFSRRQPLDPRPLDLNMVVRDSTELLHRTLGETIELEGVLASRLWTVEVDQNQLETAILNLAVNARDAMPDGGKLTLETANTMLDESYAATDSEVVPGQYVVLSISDSGAGMSRETLARIFEPFFTTKDVGRGTGLGLSMVYGFVKQSGGHVTVYSEVGQGTSVKLYFPRSRSVRTPGDLVEPPPPPEGVKGEIVLVVEDNEDVRAYSAGVLRELGYSVMEAEDADAALVLLNRPGRIDLLFTDVVLPGRTGRMLADEARIVRPELKVLFTTGYSRNAIVHQGRLDPGVQLISKPFTFDQLAVRIRDVLDR